MLPVKDPAESIVVTFDFSALTSSLSSPVVDIHMDSGPLDPDPSVMKVGSPQIDGGKVYQRVEGGMHRSYYVLKCTIIGSDGVSTYVVHDVLPVYEH